MRLIMDGVTYRVRIVYNSLARAFELLEGPTAGAMFSGRDERDLTGTKFTYSMAFKADPRYLADYDALFDALSDPVNSHTITVPYGQTTLTYDAMIKGGSDTYVGKIAGVQRWDGLRIDFYAISVQKEPTT